MMSEKEMFLRGWDMEAQTTMKVLKHFPPTRQDYKPHEKSRSAKELAWTFVMEEKTGIDGAITGQINFENMQPAPATMKDVLSIYEKIHKENFNKMKNMSEEAAIKQ